MAGNITKSCKITGNGGDLTLQLPNLTYAYSLEINNASEITLPMLSSVSNGMDISYSEASELSLPELTYVGGDLVISNNRYLETLEMGELVSVQGNLEIEGNDDLAAIEGLPYLSSVGGDLTLKGGFERYVMCYNSLDQDSWADALFSIDMPTLGIVRNDIAITSTSSLNCSDVPSSLAGRSYSCNGDASNTDETDDNKTSSSDSKGDLTTGAKAGIAIGIIGLVAILTTVAFYLWRRRQRLRGHGEPEPAPPYNNGDHAAIESERKNDYEMEYYSVQPHYDASSQKNLINRSSELGRPLSSGRPGPEGRHEMHNVKDPPAAYELSAEDEVGKEMRPG